MDPLNSDTLYAGVDGGIFKSVNGGDSWSPTGPSVVYNIHDIAIDPLDSNTIFAGGDGTRSYSRSTDGGITWSSSSGIGHPYSFAIDSRDSQTIYAGVFRGVVGGAVYKSIDGGDHWFVANQTARHILNRWPEMRTPSRHGARVRRKPFSSPRDYVIGDDPGHLDSSPRRSIVRDHRVRRRLCLGLPSLRREILPTDRASAFEFRAA